MRQKFLDDDGITSVCGIAVIGLKADVTTMFFNYFQY